MTSVHVVINPASGKDEPILNTLNTVWGGLVEWDVSITHKSGDAHRIATDALAAGVDIVAVYGGDGTVSEVVDALRGQKGTLALLPGGTGNGAARMLGIPMTLAEAAALIVEPHELRQIDLGLVNNRPFILRTDIGFMAQAGAETPRPSKDRFGKWAYAITAFQNRALLEPIPYEMTLDGKEVEVEGIMALIINMGAVAFGQRPLANGISPDDGLLDLMVLTRNDFMALAEVATSALLGNPTSMQHWQIKRAEIRTIPAQKMAADGEPIEYSPAQIQVLPQAVSVIVPLPEPVENAAE